MIPREILEHAFGDYEKAVEEIQGMEESEVGSYLVDSKIQDGICYYLDEKFGVSRESLKTVFGRGYLGNNLVLDYFSERHLPTITHRLQLRINKLKELLEK